MAQKTEARELRAVREAVLQLSELRAQLADAAEAAVKRSGQTAHAYSEALGPTATSLRRLLARNSALTKAETVQVIAVHIGEKRLGNEMAKLLREYGALNATRFMSCNAEVIRSVFDLMEAHGALEPKLRIEEFASLFGEQEEAVLSALKGGVEKAAEGLKEKEAREAITETLLAQDFVQRAKQIVVQRTERRTALRREIRALIEQQRPAHKTLTALGQAIGVPVTQLSEVLTQSRDILSERQLRELKEALQTQALRSEKKAPLDDQASLTARVKELTSRLQERFGSILRVSEEAGIHKDLLYNARAGRYASERLRELIAILEACLKKQEQAAAEGRPHTARREPPVLTEQTFEYFDGVPTDDELFHMEHDLIHARVLLERCAQMSDPEARQRVQEVLTSAVLNLGRAVRIFPYPDPKLILQVFPAVDEEQIFTALGGSTTNVDQATKKGKRQS